MSEFKDKVAVITGGGSGIGLAIAKKLDMQGAKVSLFGRNEKKLKQSASSLNQGLAISGDVTKIADLDRLYLETKNKWGNIDILVANAGVASLRHVKDVDEKFFDEIVDINYKGVYFTVQRSLPFLNPGASIILISSAAGHITWPEHSVYSSTKAAVGYLAKSFASDLLDRGMRVNAISPGFVDTPLFGNIKEDSPETIERINKIIPAGRFAAADEIADTALFLASNKSSYIIGADILVDGGLKAIFSKPKVEH